MQQKKCFKCDQVKDLSEFYTHPRMADGHLNKCKDCTRNDVSSNRSENIDRIREYDRQRGKLPHRIKKTAQVTKKYRAQNPERNAANCILNHRLRDGHIVKPKACAKCGSESRLHAHHNDYSKPLDVI